MEPARHHPASLTLGSDCVTEAWTPIDAVYVDLDNTLIDGSALFHVGRALASQGVISRGSLMRMAGHHVVYRMAGERPALVQAARDRSLSVAGRLRVSEVIGRVERMYEQVLAPRLRAAMVEVVDAHRRAGTPVWLATAAPTELAELIADRLSLSGALGTHAEVVDGAWTGRLRGQLLHGDAKAQAVREHAVAHGWNLAGCVAYSDSLQDLPLLTSVGYPSVVNPERPLRRIAEQRGWPVLDFRTRPVPSARPTAARDDLLKIARQGTSVRHAVRVLRNVQEGHRSR